MKKLLILICAMTMLNFASAKNSNKETTGVLRKITESPHQYRARLAYIPNFTEGAIQPPDLYGNAIFDLKIQVLAWQPPIESLAGILARIKLIPSTDLGRWAAGVRIEDRTNSSVVFSAEISVPIHVIAINGNIYTADPEIIQWFKHELLPAVKALNKGHIIKDL